jgi:hypothetical protein
MSFIQSESRGRKMKKVVIAIILGFLILGMPLATAFTNADTKSSKPMVKSLDTEPVSLTKTVPPARADEPPNWANGNFTGVWGFDIWGEFHIPVGWMFGYYNHNPKFGYFYAAFGYFGHENISWFIQGYFFGPFMFGSLGENESANTTLFVGIGRYNETDYHWRLMGETGPTFFIDGQYTKFD